MSTSRGIHNIISPYPMGDVEKYFVKLDRMIGTNSGDKNYGMMTHNCYSTSTPFQALIPTKFRLTDNTYDIIDMSQGLLQFKINFDLEFKIAQSLVPQVSTCGYYEHWWFVGLKSGAQLIDNYTVYSNGRLTACKQVKSVEEQAIVFNCKSNEQMKARPGIYTAHEDVLQMKDCVCGIYVAQPNALFTNGTCPLITNLQMEVLVQVDDLLPFSGMKYYPRFACGELEIELALTLEKNFVFCPIPYETVHRSRYSKESVYKEMKWSESEKQVNVQCKYYPADHMNDGLTEDKTLYHFEDLAGPSVDYLTELIRESQKVTDYRFHQCGEYCRTYAAITDAYHDYRSDNANLHKNHLRSAPIDAADELGKAGGVQAAGEFNQLVKKIIQFRSQKQTEVTIIPRNLVVTDAKSFVYGFNIKDQTKQNLLTIFHQQKKMIIPAQWINHQIFNQRPGDDQIKIHMNLPMYEVSEMIFTFPQNEVQRTVFRNPYLMNLKCQLDSKMVPDKDISTVESAHAEMTLSALGFDSFFSPNPALVNALHPPKLTSNDTWFPRNKDDSNYMFVVDLERNGSGVHHDGYTNVNALINLDANLIGGTNNPHYNEKHMIKNSNYNSTADLAADLADGNSQVTIGYANNYAPINLYTVCDAYWLFTPSGGEFMKEGAASRLVREKEINIAVNHRQ